MTFLRRTLAAAGLTLAAVAPLHAQSLDAVRTTSFGISGGAAFPTGDGTDGLNTGYLIAGSLGFRPVNSKIGFRLEAMYARFGADGFSFDDGTDAFAADGNVSIFGGIANAVLTIPTESGVHPYVIGGVGIYNVKASVDVSGSGGSFSGSDSQTKVGLNGGAGLEFPLSGFSSFVEVRYHSIFTDGTNSNFVPLTFGLRF